MLALLPSSSAATRIAPIVEVIVMIRVTSGLFTDLPLFILASMMAEMPPSIIPMDEEKAATNTSR